MHVTLCALRPYFDLQRYRQVLILFVRLFMSGDHESARFNVLSTSNDEVESPRVQLDTELGPIEVILDQTGTVINKNKQARIWGICRHIRHGDLVAVSLAFNSFYSFSGAQDLFSAGVVFWK